MREWKVLSTQRKNLFCSCTGGTSPCKKTPWRIQIRQSRSLSLQEAQTSSSFWLPSFCPQPVPSRHSIQICTMVQRLVHILWEQTLQALSAVSVKGMLSFRLAKVLGDEPCLHQDAASLLWGNVYTQYTTWEKGSFTLEVNVHSF